MKDILVLYDGGDAEKWVEYINDMLCKNELALTIECKNLLTDLDEISREIESFLVISVLVSPDMLETLSSASVRLAPVIQKHACVSVILLYTDLNELKNKVQKTYTTMDKWKHFDITQKPDAENKKTMSEIIDLLEKERERHKAIEEAKEKKRKEVITSKDTTTATKLTQDEPKIKQKSKGAVEKNPKETKRGTRHARSILETVCPKKVSKSGEEVVMILKQPLEGIVQAEFKKAGTKIDTKKINPYCYSFIAPDLGFGRQQFYVYVDGKKQSLSSLHYVAPTQMAYECPAFLCQALDITPGDLDSLDRRLTGIFRASLPNDESLSRILSPATLATEAAASQVDHHFPTLLHFAAFHGLRDLCNALLDMPGAVAAFHKTNIDNKDPLELAEDAQHDDLADFFRDYLEMQETVITYQQLYVHMYDKEGKAPGQPAYLEMIGHGPDHVESIDYDEDEYEIKRSTLESGVVEVMSDEDIVEEPRPDLPPRKPKPPATLVKPPSKPDTSPAPPVTPRKPRPGSTTLPQESPEEFFGMVGDSSPLRPVGTGSSTLNELVEIQEAFKRKEINERDVDMLYTSWTERYKEGKASASMKERQKQLSEMKERYSTLIKTAEKKEKRGFFDRLTKKKKPAAPAIEIQHIPTSNPYTSWSQVPSGFQRDARLSTLSNSSTSSSSSYASSTSRDSAMSLQNIPESDSDLDELDEAPPPPVPTRRRSTERPKDDHRKSLSEQFLLSVQNKPSSRLPQPPPQHYKARTLPAKAPAQRTVSAQHSQSQSPDVPSRKISY